MTHLLAKMTWEDVNDAVSARRVVLVPVGAIEQHGPHLPIDTDNLSVTAVCERAAEAAPDLLVCAPPIHYGFNEHNMDFPGTVTVDADHFVHYCTDVAKSFGRMGSGASCSSTATGATPTCSSRPHARRRSRVPPRWPASRTGPSSRRSSLRCGNPRSRAEPATPVNSKPPPTSISMPSM